MKGLEHKIEQRFLTAEQTPALLREWDPIFLQTILSKYPENMPATIFEAFTDKLTDIEFSLSREYRSKPTPRGKQLSVVKDALNSQLAYYSPAYTIKGVISNFHASLSMPGQQSGQLTQVFTPVPHFVDRRVMPGKRLVKKEQETQEVFHLRLS